MENIIETLKQDLAIKNDVTLSQIYKIFDVAESGMIGVSDMVEALHNLHITPLKDEAYLLFSRLDRDGDGQLKYSDICESILPKQTEYAQILANRVNRPGINISSESLDVLGRLIEAMIDIEISNERTKAELGKQKYFVPRKEFERCDVQGVGFFTREDV